MKIKEKIKEKKMSSSEKIFADYFWCNPVIPKYDVEETDWVKLRSTRINETFWVEVVNVLNENDVVGRVTDWIYNSEFYGHGNYVIFQKFNIIEITKMKTIELESLQKKDKFEDFLREFYPSKVNCWSSLSSKELILLIEKFNQHSKETLP